jgi:hypothetical protein
VIRRRVESDNLTPGLNAIAVRSDDRITVFVSEAIPARLQRASGQSALRAASRAGWTRNLLPAPLLLFTGASLWRAAFASGARRFAVAGSAALILAVTIGAVLIGPAHTPPVREVITPVMPGSTPLARGATNRAAHSPRQAQTPRPGRARVVAHEQRQRAQTRSATPAPTAAALTGSSPSPDSSPDASPSPSPTKTKHCILVLFC